MRFADLLTRAGETPVALQAAITRAEQAAAEAVGKMEELGRKRRAALVADDDKVLDAVERDLALATRDRDRATIARLELLDRLHAAQQAERRARLDGIYDAGTKAQEKAAAIIKGRYCKLASEMANLVRELQQLDAEVAEANHRLTVEGDERRVASVDDVARPPGGPIRMQPQSIPAGLRIPDPGDGGRMLFPAVDIFGSPLPKPAQDRAA